jgi:putative transport protein
MENQNKKSLKWLWITLALVAVAAVGFWVIYSGIQNESVDSVFSLSVLLVGIFIITALGYMLGRVTIKGVNLGTAGVFLVAILFGFLCSLDGLQGTPVIGNFYLTPASTITAYYKKVISNIGLVMFVGSVGFIAGPKFFRDLKKNFKTYILMGIIIILAGTAVAVGLSYCSPYGSDFWSGVLSGALTSTPGYSAAQEAMAIKGQADTLVTIGHAIAYPFGVIGVVLFVQLLPKFLKADMSKERALLSGAEVANTEEKKVEGLFSCDNLGFTAFAIAIVSGLILGAIKIPLYDGANFSLGTTGGVLIMCLVFGHFGRIGKLSLEVPAATTKVLKELGLMLFLIGAGVEGGVNLVAAVGDDTAILVWGFVGGAVMTILPMIVGYFIGGKVLKLPLLNNLGSITGGMTSTPALGTLIATAETEDVASAYASTYPIALVLIVLACNLMIGLI